MRHLFIPVFAVLLMTSCKKMSVETPEFDVQLDKLVYKVDDTVHFKMEGKVENITFYSGERGFRYANKDAVTIEKGVPQLLFGSALAGTAQPNSLKVLVTTALVGTDAAGVTSSNWTDITSRVILASNSTTTSSGTVDLSEFAAVNSPFVLAFKFDAVLKPTVAQPTWVIRSFGINSVYGDGTNIPIATLAGTPWTSFNIKNPVAGWTFSATELRMVGGAANSPDNEDWIITGPLNLNTTKEIADFGVSIQNIASSRINSYTYVYKQPGVYKVAFVGFNNNIDGNKQVTKEFEITVQP